MFNGVTPILAAPFHDDERVEPGVAVRKELLRRRLAGERSRTASRCDNYRRGVSTTKTCRDLCGCFAVVLPCYCFLNVPSAGDFDDVTRLSPRCLCRSDAQSTRVCRQYGVRLRQRSKGR